MTHLENETLASRPPSRDETIGRVWEAARAAAGPAFRETMEMLRESPVVRGAPGEWAAVHDIPGRAPLLTIVREADGRVRVESGEDRRPVIRHPGPVQLSDFVSGAIHMAALQEALRRRVHRDLCEAEGWDFCHLVGENLMARAAAESLSPEERARLPGQTGLPVRQPDGDPPGPGGA